MNFLALIIALLLRQLWAASARLQQDDWLRRWQVINSVPSTRNLIQGTSTLATKIRMAMSQEPPSANSITPLMMVFSLALPSSVVNITGSVFAGM